MRHPFPMPKLYSYTRFSTPDQEAGDSARRQMEAAKKFADERGLELDDSLRIADLGVSAYRGANLSTDAGLGMFMEAVREGLVEEGSILLVESLDRFSRMEPLDVQHELTGLLRKGVKVATLADGKVYSRETLSKDNGLGLMIALMVSIRAHEESAMKGKRVAEAWAEKRRKVRSGEAKKLTRRSPAWLQWGGEDWEVLSDKAETVRRVYAMTLSGAGEHSIAETLNQEGVKPLGRAKRWHRSSVSKLLRNRAVIGDLVPGRIEYRDGKKRRVLEDPIEEAFPAIISDADWKAVRALKDGRNLAARGRNAARPLANLLGGLARCPRCASTMTRIVKGKKGGPPKLVCTKAKAGAGCKYRTVPLEAVEEAVLSSGGRLLETIPAGDGRWDAEAFKLEATIAGTLDHMRDLGEALEDNPSKAGAARLAKLERELETLEDQLADLNERRRMLDGGLIRDRLERLYDKLEAGLVGGREEANALLKTLFDGVTVDYLRGLLLYHWRQGGETNKRFEMPEA